MSTHRITLKMKDPSFERNGETFPGNLAEESETVWHIDPNECEHKYTLCIRCIRDWTNGYWATIHFGPDRPKSVAPSVSLNEFVEIQEAFVTTVQLMVEACRPLFDAIGAASAQVMDWATEGTSTSED